MFCACTGSVTGNRMNAYLPPMKKLVVMELFTSQGCSSCPPADRLLGKYAADSNVIALSFHVDYWNRLGWTDPFSDHAYTERQENYGRQLGDDVYTPQLVINGQTAMVGSDGERVEKTINGLKPATANIRIDSVEERDGKVFVSWLVNNLHPHSEMNIALVQDKATTAIRAGENKGIELTNYHVVRSFTTISAAKEKQGTSFDKNVKGKQGLSLVLYLQDRSGIYAAISVNL